MTHRHYHVLGHDSRWLILAPKTANHVWCEQHLDFHPIERRVCDVDHRSELMGDGS